MKEDFRLKLKGDTLVCIDWANVYGWRGKLKWEVDVFRLIDYFKTYPEIKKIHFYFGTDINEESKNFVNSVAKLENKIFKLITKKVKYIPIEFADDNGKEIFDGKKRRKCDFDVEITRDALNNANNFQTFILMSGDGDYAPLIDDLIFKDKKTILIFARGRKGREYGDFKTGLFLCSVAKMKEFLKK
jgi:uncharacterized LabA/DUF88 family protein